MVFPDWSLTNVTNKDKDTIIFNVFSGPNCDFTCRDGSNCYPMSWVCDGLRDCDDGSDEANCAGR